MSMRSKLLLGLMVVLIPAEIGGLLAVGYAESEIRGQIDQTLIVTAQLEADRVDRELGDLARQAELMAGILVLKEALIAGDAPPGTDLSRAIVNDRFGVRVWGMTVLRNDGSVLTSTRSLPGAEELIRATGDRISFGRARRVGPDDHRILAAAPVWQVGAAGRDRLGTLLVDLDIAPVVEAVARHDRLGDTGEVYLVRRASAERAEFVTPPRFGTDIVMDGRLDIRRDVLARRALVGGRPAGVFEAADYRGEDVLAVTVPIDRMDWGLVVKLDRSEALSAVADLRRFLLATLGVASLGVVIIASLLVRSFVDRLRRITREAERVAAGDLDRRIRDPNDDEIGQLARAFDRMTGSLSTDIARRRAAEEELSYQALHDPLTDLPNRTQLRRHLEDALGAGTDRLGLLFCDLDGFKAVNDEYGHDAGDSVLRLTARRLHNAVGQVGMLSRFGGDEFILVVTGDELVGDVDRLAHQLRDSLDTPIVFGAHQAVIGVSIGVAVAEPGDSPDRLLREADAAMYRAKARGRDRIVHAGATDLTDPFAEIELDLRGAMERGELELFFQPVVDLRAGGIISAEALIRWRHPERGLLTPVDMLPQIRAAGLMPTLDRWVLERACDQLARWIASGAVGPQFSLAVNVTTPLLDDPGSREQVGRMVRAAGLRPGSLCLEITEEALVGDPEAVGEWLRDLKADGISLAIDDFGTRHSNLDRVRFFPVDTLKVDRCFVRDLAENGGDRAITAGIIAIARALGLAVIAEGIETSAQEAILLDLGCDRGQGYRYAEPLPVAEFELRVATPRGNLVAG